MYLSQLAANGALVLRRETEKNYAQRLEYEFPVSRDRHNVSALQYSGCGCLHLTVKPVDILES